MERFVRVASTSEIQPGQGKLVEVDGRYIALFNTGGAYYAIDNTCLHRGGPLAEGSLEGKVVTCPWHGWSYDVTTGANTVNPNICVRTYPVKVEGTDLQVAV